MECYPGKGDKSNVAIPVESNELYLSSLKRGASLLVGTQAKLEDLLCFGKNMGLGKYFLKKVMLSLPSAFANPHPPFANSLGASASLRRCVPPLLLFLLFKQAFSLHLVWKKLYGTYAPVSCNRLLSLLNEIKRLWRHTCVKHQCVVISCAT